MITLSASRACVHSLFHPDLVDVFNQSTGWIGDMIQQKFFEPKVGSDISPWGETWLMFMAIVHLIMGDRQANHEFNLSPIRVGKLC